MEKWEYVAVMVSSYGGEWTVDRTSGTHDPGLTTGTYDHWVGIVNTFAAQGWQLRHVSDFGGTGLSFIVGRPTVKP